MSKGSREEVIYVTIRRHCPDALQDEDDSRAEPITDYG
jgi:hypothetical protein